MPTEEEIKQSEFEEEALPYRDSLYYLIFLMVRNHEHAEELTQEVMYRAYRGWDRYDKGSNIKAWLETIATHTVFNYYRRYKRREQLDEDIELYDLRLSSDPSNNPDSIFDTKTVRNTLEASLSVLPEEFRSVMALIYIDDLSYEQVVETLHIPIGTVKSRVFRGVKKLKQILISTAPDILQE